MRVRRTVLSIGLLACTVPVAAVAQGQGIAITPLVSYGLETKLASEDGFLDMTAAAAAAVGAEIEFGLSKTMGLAIGGTYTFSQTLDFDVPGFGSIGTADITAPRIYGLLSIRPGGRRPNGAVTALAIQIGGGVTMWTGDKVLIDTDGDGVQESYPGDDLDGTEPFAFAGVAYNIPIGPRSTLQVFGRAVGGFGYSSQFLDDLNAAAGSNVEGKFAITPVFGVGLRIGR